MKKKETMNNIKHYIRRHKNALAFGTAGVITAIYATYKLSKRSKKYFRKGYVTGSMADYDEIMRSAEELKQMEYYGADYVQLDPVKTIEEIISERFNKIEKSDFIVAIRRPDRTFDNETLYELEYAKRCNKKVLKWWRDPAEAQE